MAAALAHLSRKTLSSAPFCRSLSSSAAPATDRINWDSEAYNGEISPNASTTSSPATSRPECEEVAEELLAARAEYHRRFKRSLEEDVAAHTNGDFRKGHGVWKVPKIVLSCTGFPLV